MLGTFAYTPPRHPREEAANFSTTPTPLILNLLLLLNPPLQVHWGVTGQF